MTSRSVFFIAGVALICALAFPATPSFARKINNDTAAEGLTQCLLTDDSKSVSAYGRFACCSSELGYCIRCNVNQPFNCERLAYTSRPRGLLGLLPNAPAVGPVAPSGQLPGHLQQLVPRHVPNAPVTR